MLHADDMILLSISVNMMLNVCVCILTLVGI